MNTTKENILQKKETHFQKEEKPTPKNFLTADFQLVLHTQIAQRLYDGDWKYGRMGLLQFASAITILWKSSKQDDPYAEWYLLKIYDALQEAKNKLKHLELKLTEQLSQLRGFEIGLMSHPAPLKQPLRFASPFAFMAATLIEQVDYINRQLFTLQRLGLMPDEKLLPKDLVREIQMIFQLPRQWKYTGVTRSDIVQNNQKAQKAKKLLGELPSAILNKEIQFAFLPKQAKQ